MLLLNAPSFQLTIDYGQMITTPRENPSQSLRFSSGDSKERGQNPDTMEAKTVKTKIKTQFGKKWVKIPLSWHNFERL